MEIEHKFVAYLRIPETNKPIKLYSLRTHFFLTCILKDLQRLKKKVSDDSYTVHDKLMQLTLSLRISFEE